MPAPTISRQDLSPASDSPHKDLKFDNTDYFHQSNGLDSDQMIFGPLDLDERPQYRSMGPYSWDYSNHIPYSSPMSNFPAHLSPHSPHFDFHVSPTSPIDSLFDTEPYISLSDNQPIYDENTFYPTSWANEPDPPPPPSTPSSPIPIRTSLSEGSQASPPFYSYGQQSHFPQNASFSPSEFAALLPLPRSTSPAASPANFMRSDSTSISPRDTSLQPPEWASKLYVDPSSPRATSSSRTSARRSSRSDNARAHRFPIRRDVPLIGQTFQSSSAPSVIQTASPVRSYTRRSESVSVSDDRDATVRRKKRSSGPEENHNSEKASDTHPHKSLLKPPKLAPSAWQLYFTDWIQRQQASNTRKLNVAQAAKEAGQEYASLSAEEKEPFKRRSQAAKEMRERELEAYMRTLTPEDIKRENAFRAAQRKAGRSRKSNMKDPNAPKKPLSAYFMFLQRIRADPRLVQEIFGDETETTKQSVLAAAKWRSMTDDERKPFLAQAEQEKLDYEAARRLYEEGTTGFASSINFSILPGANGESSAFRSSPLIHAEPLTSESDSEGCITDEGVDQYIHS